MIPTKANHQVLSVEPLEVRSVPAGISLNSGVLTILGDDRDDAAVVALRDGSIHVEVTSTSGDRSGEAPSQLSQTYASRAVQTIRFFGSGGDDRFVSEVSRPSFADGGDGNDYLEGAGAADSLYGRAGSDTLVGNGGDDDLYGGSDDDLLRGLDGLDGLYGGGGTDALYGGGNADRFLVLSGHREHRDASAQDAVVFFRDEERAWSEAEIEQIDGGLKLLHRRTGNDNLLETRGGGALTIGRGGNRGSILAVNLGSAGRMTIYDGAFRSPTLAAVTVIHEVGHNWDAEHSRWNNWLALSGWRRSVPLGAQAGQYVRSGDGQWLHRGTANFVRSYGRTNPYEDWATAWESYFITRHNLSNATSVAALLSAKRAHLDAFFASLS